MLARTLWLRGLTCPQTTFPEVDTRKTAKEMPAFRALVLDSEQVVRGHELRDRESMFAFFNATSDAALKYEVIDGILYSLWGKTDECLYVVCEGTDSECRQLFGPHRLTERYGETIKVLVDDSSTLVARFGMTTTPSAMLFDEHGRAKKIGQLVKVSESVPGTPQRGELM
jgi:hypothetical protein